MKRARDLAVVSLVAVLVWIGWGLDPFSASEGALQPGEPAIRRTAHAQLAPAGGFGWRWPRVEPDDEYPLDHFERHVPTEGRLQCPDVDMVRYRGEVVRYASPIRVAEVFVPKLRAFEEAVRDVAVRHYGRAPRRIVHLGTHNCRRVRGRPYRMSEHALGNGIDVSGFSFGPASRELRRASPDMPRHLTRPFEVTVLRHWYADSERGEAHARFLRDLTEELAERGVFRAMIGPRHRFHRNHFHFDYGPFRYRIL